MSEEKRVQWFVYVLRCCDGTLYCGITTDLQRRLNEHNSQSIGASYTRARRPVTLLKHWPSDNRSTATRQELAFKRLSRPAKEALLLSADQGV